MKNNYSSIQLLLLRARNWYYSYY